MLKTTLMYFEAAKLQQSVSIFKKMILMQNEFCFFFTFHLNVCDVKLFPKTPAADLIFILFIY